MFKGVAVVVACLTAALFVGTATQNSTPDLVITGVTVIDGTGAAPARRTVVVRAGRVERLLPPDTRPAEGVPTLDGRGRFLIPGLWDMHVHLAARPEPELAERIMLPLFLASGVVGVRDIGGPAGRVVALRDRVRSGAIPGPRIITPGPFVDGPGEADPMFRRIDTAADAASAVRELAEAGADFVKVQASLSPDAYAAVMRAARARGLAVAGHVPVAVAAAAVVAAGQRSIEHISPALPGDAGLLFACSSRESELRAELLSIERDRATAKPEAIRAREAVLRQQLIDTYDAARADRVGRTLHRAGTWIVPTLVWSNSFRPLGASDDGSDVPLEYVPVETRKRWQDGRQRYLKAAPPEAFAAAAAVAKASATAVGALHAAGARVLAGTDTFDGFVLPGSSLVKELGLLVGAGLSPLQALQAATRSAAEYRGDLAREGTVEQGKRADLVLLDADPLADIRNVGRVHAVILGGRLFTTSDLDALRAQVIREASRTLQIR
jgi:imidazolonepropionase-like amidohydrolase